MNWLWQKKAKPLSEEEKENAAALAKSRAELDAIRTAILTLDTAAITEEAKQQRAAQIRERMTQPMHPLWLHCFGIPPDSGIVTLMAVPYHGRPYITKMASIHHGQPYMLDDSTPNPKK